MVQFQAETHSLLRLYRFRKEAWEETYAAKSRGWRWYPCMVHFYGRILFNSAFVISIRPGDPQTPEFWVYVAIMAVALACLLLGHFSRFGRRWIVELHFALCVGLIGAHAYLCPQQVATSSTAAYLAWVPSPAHHMVLEGPDGQRTQVDRQLFDSIRQVMAGFATVQAMGEMLPLLMHTALTGLTPYTLPTTLLTLLGMACSFSFTPGIQTEDLVWALAMLAINMLFFGGFAAVVERWGRKQFLAETFLARELHASQTADSILNHTLKNVLSDAAATIELFLAGT
eukprot:EG_transcript_22082